MAESRIGLPAPAPSRLRGAVASAIRADALLIALIVLAGLTIAYWQYTQDDVYITYTYSRNLAEGQGFVFNPGEHVQGTTTPLYTLLMAAVYRITPDLLHAGNLISAACLAGIVFSLAHLLRQHLSRYAQAGLVLLLASAPIVYVSFGMETLLYSLMLCVACLLWASGHRRSAMLAAAGLTWLRADGIVLGGTLGLLALGEGIAAARRGEIGWGRAFPWDLAAIYALGIAPWFGFAWLYFGSPLPNTFAAKQAMLSGLLWWTDGAGWWRSFYGNNALSLLAVPLIGVGLWRAWRIPRLRPLAAWPVLYVIGYTALNVTAFWYYTPLTLILIALAALGGQTVAARLIRRGAPRRAVIAAGGGLILLSTVLGVANALGYAPPPPRIATYTLAGQWIAAHTDPEATLMVGDLGIVGYYAHRATLDTPGLIVPDMHVRTPASAVLKYQPDLVLATRYFSWEAIVHEPWFEALYAPLAAFSTPGDADFSPMTVYRRRYSATPPAQVVAGSHLMLTCPVSRTPDARTPAGAVARLDSLDGETLITEARPGSAEPEMGEPPPDQAESLEVQPAQLMLRVNVPPGMYRWRLDCGETQSATAATGTLEVLPVEAGPGYTAVSEFDLAAARPAARGRSARWRGDVVGRLGARRPGLGSPGHLPAGLQRFSARRGRGRRVTRPA